ncbi:MAG: MamK family actin-like protein [Rhodothermales bacterium]|nr:MamK family actin-like protein [Rhodothermales bacterium]
MAAKKRKTTTKKADDVLHIGIDLGTSRSAIAASNGKRNWVESYVGWPKDFVARKMLGKEILFGEEALKNRLSVQLVRPLENGVIREGTDRDVEAVKELLHHLIGLVEPGENQKIHAAVGVPAEALRVNKLAIRDTVREYADALMIVSEPFAVAYGQGALNNALVIDIGAGTVDFCIMHGTMPGEEDQRTLTTGGDYVDRQLLGRLTERFPAASFNQTQVRHFKEQYGFVGKTNGRVKVSVPVEGKPVEHDITDAVQQTCGSIIAPIVEATIDLIARYDPEFQDQVKRNIFLAGGGSQIRGIITELEDALKEYGSFKVAAVDDPLFAGADGALALAQDMPQEYWDEMG